MSDLPLLKKCSFCQCVNFDLHLPFIFYMQLISSQVILSLLWCFQKVFCVQQWIGQASSSLKKRYFNRNRYFYVWTLPSQTATKAPSLPPIFSWVQLLSTHALQLQVTKPKTATACAVSPLPSLLLLCGTSPKGAVKVGKKYISLDGGYPIEQ